MYIHFGLRGHRLDSKGSKRLFKISQGGVKYPDKLILIPNRPTNLVATLVFTKEPSSTPYLCSMLNLSIRGFKIRILFNIDFYENDSGL